MVFEVACQVVLNEQVGPSLYVMELTAPQIAENAIPGQFIHMNIPTMPDHILRRPFCVYYRDIDRGEIGLLYQVVGSGTEELTNWENGQECSVIGPIGNGWSIPSNCEKALIVGGGVGAAPLYMLYEKLIESGIQADVILGAATKESLIFNDKFAQVNGVDPTCSTDDGSFGFSGFCTVPAKKALESASADDSQYDMMFVCGPTPLMRACMEMANDFGVSCQVSLEKRMACGIGACLSCVVDTVSGKKRVCVDGPIFDSRELVW